MDIFLKVDNVKAYQKIDKAVIFNLDCRYILDKIPNESVDLFCSDIPYKLARKGTGIKKERKKIYAVEYLIVLMKLVII